ncbi:NAD(P)-binding protein [Auriculariales sp. MPI-PUGE-AT-0066]|nr:NAD(P)-binding protein [Auriculariales sp. MPI-PUGE-AT-0066]
MTAVKPRLVAIVTGANAGVGYGICRRLLSQMSLPDAPDSHAQKLLSPEDAPSPYDGAHELTLIMACRSRSRAEAAREKLLADFDSELAVRQESDPNSAEYGQQFRAALAVDIVLLDVSDMRSVLSFCDTVSANYPYVTHIVMNAAMANFIGINWLKVPGEILTKGYVAFYRPRFTIQSVSTITSDGLGAVWVSNVLSAYTIVERLRPKLRAAPYDSARVLWMSSLEAMRNVCNEDIMADYQLTAGTGSYEMSKYQITLLAPEMQCREDAREASEQVQTSVAAVKHIIVHPGITSSSIYVAALRWWILLKAMDFAFYLARWMGSPYHVIDALSAALVATHVILTNLANLPSAKQPVMYGARCNRLGRPYVGPDPIDEWDENKHIGGLVADQCERLYRAFATKFENGELAAAPATNGHATGKINGHANGHMNGHANGKVKVYTNGTADGHHTDVVDESKVEVALT